MSKKIALIESGTYYHYFAMNDERFKSNFDELIYAPNLSGVDLSRFDVVIVADRNHIKYLVENKDKLVNFALKGGILCVLGENSVEKWIDGVKARARFRGYEMGCEYAETFEVLREEFRLEEVK